MKWQQVLQGVERPFAWVDEEALHANIATVARATNKPIRIATKSVRSVELLEMIAQKLPRVAGFMTFSAAETVYLVERGFDQLLIGYPVMEEASVRRLLQYIKEGKEITFMVDSIAQVAWLCRLAVDVGVAVPICIDLNMSVAFPGVYFGTKRSPLTSYEAVAALLHDVQRFPVIVRGVMAYEAQIAGVQDYSMQRLKSAAVRQLKTRSREVVEKRQRELVGLIRSFHELAFVNGGGSGSITFTDGLDVTEITVGSAFLAPALFDGYEGLVLQPAAGFALSVVRQFDAETFVCHGGGYVASGASGHDRLPVFYEPNRFALTKLEGADADYRPSASLANWRYGVYAAREGWGISRAF